MTTARAVKIAAIGAAIAVLALWLRTAVWVVNPSETGVVLAFGRLEGTAPPGMQFTLPWPFGRLIAVNTSTVMPMPVGFKLEDVQFNLPPTEDEVQWLTGDTNIVDLKANVLFTVKDAARFVFGVAPMLDRTDSTALIDRTDPRFVIRKAAETVLTREIARMKIDELLSSGKVELQMRCVPQIQELLDDIGLGVSIAAVNILEVSPPPAVIRKFNAVVSAAADRERRISEANGYRSEKEPQARAKANAIVSDAGSYATRVVGQAEAAAGSFEKILAEVRKNPELAKRKLWLEAAKKLLARCRTIVFRPNADGSPFRVFLDG